ncbi:MAG: sugar-binding protein [Actinomycetota bacterium]|nr:sugar-binding protein [Actinomycetota bacterium]
MRRKRKNRIFLLDRAPYILFVLILIITIIVFFSVRSCTPFNFFSSVQEDSEDGNMEYTLFIASPTNNKVFNFINQNETVPVEIRAQEVESTDYNIRVVVNDSEIKTFSSPPYEYNWNPGSSGEYEIKAQLIDETGETIATSNMVSFTVQYEEEPKDETAESMDIEEKKNQVLTNAVFRTNNTIPTGIPIFSYKCYIPPVIDGSIQEWNKFEIFSAFEPTIKKENYTSHTDVSGTFYSCWDDDNFYIAIQVTDDVFSQNYTGNQINKGDSITIVLDTELEEDMQIPFYNSDDYQLDLSPGNFAGTLAEAFISWPSSSPPGGVLISSTSLSNGYIIEASIPWYNFPNYIAEDESVIGFTISILDTDNLDTTELVISSSKTFDLNNVSTLGAIALIDVGDIQSEEEDVTEEEEESEE